MAIPFYPVLAAAAIDIDGTVLVQMVVFLFVIIFLHYTLFQPFLRTLEARQEGVHGSREEAAELDARAAMMLVEFDNKMNGARRDAQEIRESLRTQGLSEQNEIVDEVRDELNAKLVEERKAIAAKVETALLELNERSTKLAQVMVDKVIPAA
ncbi:MAG: ATP synthase F0 subunit B [Bradymonadaceae bacterium]|nr:ATP synthase F0 subunit B [Lujinxingiaceae bacterium]